jgi:3-dehydroquinate synthase
MSFSETSVTVELGARSYDVHIGEGLLGLTGAFCRRAGLTGTAAVITDSKVGPLYGEKVSDSLQENGIRSSLHTISSGEGSKCYPVVQQLSEELAASRLDRHSFIVALGGGVVGDVAGFLAAIYLRGIAYVQIPTTVMAQVDSAVGGKTGINLEAGKNLIGAFHQPRFVLADTATLATLPRRERNEGFAEVIKYGVISDPELLDALEKSDFSFPELVRRCVSIKAQLVSQDEEERHGRRALLNFGHTIGHAIEAAAGYGRYLHGEAISLGIVAAGMVSERVAGFSKAEQERVRNLLERFQLPTRLDRKVTSEVIQEKLATDKKFVNGRIRFVVADRLGSARLTDQVAPEDLQRAVADLAQSAS